MVQRGSMPSGASGWQSGGLKVRWNKTQEFYVENLYILQATNARQARYYIWNIPLLPRHNVFTDVCWVSVCDDGKQ
jgi:hypothetical protein